MAPPFLAAAVDGGELPASHPCRFTAGVRAPGTHCTGGCLGPRSDLDAKILSQPSSLYPVAIPTELSQEAEATRTSCLRARTST
jgi:hypothetical protein